MNSHSRTGILLGLLAAAIWGGMYVVSKVVLEVVPPFTLLTLRLLLGIASLAAWIRWQGSWPQLGRGQWLRLLGVGVLGYGVSLGFQFAGTQLSTAANGAVITAATPAFVFLFAWLLLRERIGRRQVAALLLSTIGVLLIIDPFRAGVDTELGLGNLLLVGAAVTWALYSVLVRRSTQQLDPLTFTLIAFIGGLLVTVPAAAVELRTHAIGTLSAGMLAGILYLGVISTAVAAYMWNKAFAVLPAGIAALTFFAQPVVGAGLGIGLLGEPFTLQFAAGAALILLCLWMSSLAFSKN
ncbi:MAG: DMT family transporter [Anaerolineales bacterium]|nr:MAG: DMT family transporter [Anaerolineales bacterium]